MKKYMLQAAAGAALMASVGAADAATYTLSFTPIGSVTSYAGTATVEGTALTFSAPGYLSGTGTIVGSLVAFTGSYFGAAAAGFASLSTGAYLGLAAPFSFFGGTVSYTEVVEEAAPVPLPAALPLLALALGATGVAARRRKAA